MTTKSKMIRNLPYTILVIVGAMAYSTSASATCTGPVWKVGETYSKGAVVQYNGHSYKIIQPHTVWSEMWTPSNVPALWADMGMCGPATIAPPPPNKPVVAKPQKPFTQTIQTCRPAGVQTPLALPSCSGADAPRFQTATVTSPPPPDKSQLFVVHDPAKKTPDVANGDGYLLTEEQFNKMFPQRNPLYTYAGLMLAQTRFPGFISTGDATVQKQEWAAFLANVGHETGDLVYAEEINKAPYCQSSAQYPCAPGKQYYGRGPLQISWNYNYGQIGEALGEPLLTDPDRAVNDPMIIWATAMWFWMNQSGAGTMTAHSAITTGKGFGETIRTINGALECNGGNPGQVNDRISRYQRYTGILGVSTGSGNLGC